MSPSQKVKQTDGKEVLLQMNRNEDTNDKIFKYFMRNSEIPDEVIGDMTI